MKQISCLFGVWMCCVCLCSQTTTVVSPYLFDSFQECLIVYKDGRQFTAPINYDLIRKHYVFLNEDKKELEFENPELISFFRVGDRVFLAENQEAVEMVQGNPPIKVAYAGNIRKAPKAITYGGTTQTAPVDSYAGLPGSGIAVRAQADNRIVTGINHTYEVKDGRKTKRFYHKKSFLKLFPKEERDSVNSYIDSQTIHFDSVRQVVELINSTFYKR